MPEYITIKVLADEFKANRSLFSEVEYKEVSIKDSFFDGDLQYKDLKDKSAKAYKELKIYEFKHRNP